MRIAILWTGLSGYLNSCLKELAGREGVEMFVSHQAPVKEAPFNDNIYAWISNRLEWRSSADLVSLKARLRTFDPEILVFSSWHLPAYRQMAKEVAKSCRRVMVIDNCWTATLKQRMGKLISPWYIRPLADMIWVPGERQAVFARKLGFKQRAILWGLLSCDQPAIETVHMSRLAEGRALPHSFLFVGRFISEKGVNQLIEAYQSYRERSIDPWPLVCCGAGPLRCRLEGRPGIRVEGFVQPDRLREVLASSGCLILPSTFEPWAVVVHEATSAGLLILTSKDVGASAHLVQDNYNGYIFDGWDVNELVALMSHVSEMSEARLDAMSRASHLLSKQFTPVRWADTLLETFPTSSVR
jgi:glycosyltransferase involved in cell wall biosynthesis